MYAANHVDEPRTDRQNIVRIVGVDALRWCQ